MKRYGRKLTPLMEKYFGLAKTLGLSYPLGRAIQLVSRHWNDGLYGMYTADAASRMTQTKPSTAKRWLKHWIRGGSVSHEQAEARPQAPQDPA